MSAENEPRSEAYVPPRNETEELVASIWADVFQLPRVGVTDNFFALGGHSMLAIRVQSRVRRALGVQLPVRAIFEAPTVADLSLRIAQAPSNPEESDALEAALAEFEGLSDDEPAPPQTE